MFRSCTSLNSLDLSRFDTSKVKEMNAMFAFCTSLNSLNLANFDTSQVNNISAIFKGCSKITLLDISNFNTSKITEMEHMFYGCSSLYSLNLSHFDTSSVENMNSMFYNCKSLSTLDLSNFNTSKVFNMNNLLYNCMNLTFLNISNFDTSNVNDMNNMFYNCSLLNSLDLSNFDTSNVNNIKYMFYGCQNLKYINFSISNSNAKSINIFSLTHSNLIVCGNNNDDILFDLNIFMRKHIFCDDNKNYKSIKHNYICHIKNLSNICDICGNEYFIDKNNFNDNNNLNINCILEIENRTEIIKQIINDLINEFNTSELNSGKDKKIIDKNKIIILTSTENQKNNEDINNISMDLNQCENILKYNYNISNNNSLYILQIISEEEGMKIPKIEYEVYYPLNGNNLTKLNLTSCKDTKIEISIKVKINDSFDKYNPKSDYYNDICSSATSESGTDISLKDRKNEFIDNNMSLCEENCDLIEYNFEKEKAKCSCDIKLKISKNYDIKFNKNEFLKSFTDIKNMFNLNIIKCYKKVLKIKRLIKNYGFFIVGSIIILYFISLFIFSSYSYDKIKGEIFNIIFALKVNANPIKKNIDKNKKKKKILKIQLKIIEIKIKQINFI